MLLSNVKKKTTGSPLYQRIRVILESARVGVSRTVNSTQVIANWLIGREIVEEEQQGERKAGYGDALLADLAERLTEEFGAAYSGTNLRWFRQFYLEYPNFMPKEIYHAPRDKSISSQLARGAGIHHAVRDESEKTPHALRAELAIGYAVRSQSWQPGQFHPNLSWTHYRTLLRVEKPEARSFYEIESIKNNWAARELECQINSLHIKTLGNSSFT